MAKSKFKRIMFYHGFIFPVSAWLLVVLVKLSMPHTPPELAEYTLIAAWLGLIYGIAHVAFIAPARNLTKKN